MTPTLRGAALMVLAMACFAVEDAIIKGLSASLPPAQIVWMLGGGGALVFAAWLGLSGQGLWSPDYLRPALLRRTAFEVVGTLCFVSSLALVPLATASAVIQATPLMVALGAALFLRAPVGPRRWAAILVGFGGVLVILRPGTAGFEPAVLLAVAGMLGLAGRDLSTRNLPARITGVRLSIHAFAALVPAGLLLQAAQGLPVADVSPAEALRLLLGIGIGIAGYLAVVAATRTGDIAVVSSFRYSRMLFALVLGAVVFGERPDAATLLGVVIVIGSGLYALWREARLARAPLPKPGGPR